MGSRRQMDLMYKYLPSLRNNPSKKNNILKLPILIGRVMPEDSPYQKAMGFKPGSLGKQVRSVEVRVPYNYYDAYYSTFFLYQWDFQASDEKEVCKSGDTVLLGALDDAPETTRPMSLQHEATKAWWLENPDERLEDKPITHRVLEVLYHYGDVRDPVTGKMAVAEEYREEADRRAELYGKSNATFDYGKAPPRGWQEGKRDFTARKTYKKWHVFEKDDKYGLL